MSRETLSADRPFTVAILAMGGQGGGVLADWIVALAESQGWVAQATSVPGVAQRTGATIYYLELLEPEPGKAPVLSLMPTPGEVDVVIAAELMETGRAVLRGLVTPDRTVVIASTHRSYAVSEKAVPGDGAGDPRIVEEALGFAARRTIAFDMDSLAVRQGSVVSAALFGAFAGAALLPFGRAAFEETIRGGGKGVEKSLAAFSAAFERVGSAPAGVIETVRSEKLLPPLPAPLGIAVLDALIGRIRAEFPASFHAMLHAGVRKLTEFQDPRYAADYLDRVAALLAADRAAGGEAHGCAFSATAAKYVAVAMAYDDIYRVADLKIRAARFDRIRGEIDAGPRAVIHVTEYFHPRMEEVCGSLPAWLGAWIESHPRLCRALDRRVDRGRRVGSDSFLWFLALFLVAGFRRFRRGTLRHRRETDHLEAWLATALSVLPRNYELATEILACRRLVKGYSDTHARGLSKFDRALSAVPALLPRSDGGAWLRRVREAALRDEAGEALDGVLKTIASFAA